MVFLAGYIYGNNKSVMKRLILILILLPAFSSLRAQELAPTVIATAGKDMSAGEYKLSFTIGELAVTTLKPQGYILTQGFQQPPNLYLSDIQKNENFRIGINVYPNPTRDIVNITLDEIFENIDIKVFVYNSFGQEVEVPFVRTSLGGGVHLTVDLTSFARGNYFIKLIDLSNSVVIADFKIFKLN